MTASADYGQDTLQGLPPSLKSLQTTIADPPVLSFEIERHGGTVKGSIYAEVHRWALDIKQQTASVHVAKKRQLLPKARRVDMGSIIAEFVDRLQKGQPDARLQWKGPDEVKIDYKSIIPSGK